MRRLPTRFALLAMLLTFSGAEQSHSSPPIYDSPQYGGNCVYTARSLDLGIQGHGLFRVLADTTESRIAYTRNGHFTINADRELVVTAESGYKLLPTIRIPPDMDLAGVCFCTDGSVGFLPAKMRGRDYKGVRYLTSLGHIELFDFPNPAAMKSLGNGLFQPTPASGIASRQDLNGPGSSVLLQNYLEIIPARRAH